jgi:hypothetical protein
MTDGVHPRVLNEIQKRYHDGGHDVGEYRKQARIRASFNCSVIGWTKTEARRRLVLAEREPSPGI